jgi:outer membrane receptor for ferrienterochelin and colicins
MGNLNLNPQTNRYVSAGLEYNTKQFNVSVTGYMNWLDNMITLVTIPTREAPGDIIIAYDPNRVRQYKNMDDARTTGVDLNIKWMPISSLTLTGGYSYLDTNANLSGEDKHGKAITIKDVVIDGMAHHRGTFSAAWNKGFNHNKYRLSVGLFGRFQSKRYYQDDGNGKAYQIWRLNTRHQFNVTKQIKADINAGIDNIFNYYETTPHGLNYGTTTPGRTVYASLTLQFGKQLRANRTRSNSTDE